MIETYPAISSVSYDQSEILLNIMALHNEGRPFDLDCTYSIGQFYADGRVPQPRYKTDTNIQAPDVVYARAEALPFRDGSLSSIMFDPPFIDGASPGSGKTGRMGQRFGQFEKIADLWQWYHLCLSEHYRILSKGGILIFKCQDVVSQRANFFSHCYVLNAANEHGFYAKDLFILLSKNRIRGTWKKQSHARKFHCYFWVFSKQRIKVVNHFKYLW